MAKIIDIKKKLNEKNDSYFDRRDKCLNTIKKDGVCLCNSCKTINDLSNDIIKYVLDRYTLYENKYKIKLYVGELEESLILSGIKFLDIIENEYEQDT